MVRPAQARSASDQVAQAVDKIAALVSSGRYAPGQRLTEADLTRELGLGRVPVREALRILAGDGVVELVQNLGARIRVISRTEMSEMLSVQDALIRLAIEEFVTVDSYPVHMKKITEQSAKIRDRAAAHDVRGTLRAMVRYHELVVEGSHNGYLRDITRRLYLYHYERHIRDVITFEDLMHAVPGYDAATRALAKKDAAAAYQAMRMKNKEIVGVIAAADAARSGGAVQPAVKKARGRPPKRV